MTKRLLAVVLSVLMVLGCTMTATANFNDTVENEHFEAIEILAAMGLIKGTDATSFSPDAPVRRDQMALFIARLVTALRVNDATADAVNATSFADCTNPTFYDAINFCASAGIINGRDATTYDPAGNVTLQEGIAMAVRALGYKDLAYPAGYITKAIQIGLLTKLDGAFGVAMTRAEVAQLMYNTLNNDFYVVDAQHGLYTDIATIFYSGYKETEVVVVATEKNYEESYSAADDGKVLVFDGTTSHEFDAPANAEDYLFNPAIMLTLPGGQKNVLILKTTNSASASFLTGVNSLEAGKDVVTTWYGTDGKVTTDVTKQNYQMINGVKLVKGVKALRFLSVDANGAVSASANRVVDGSKVYYSTLFTINGEYYLLENEVFLATTEVKEETVNNVKVNVTYFDIAGVDFKATTLFGYTAVAAAKDDLVYVIKVGSEAVPVIKATATTAAWISGTKFGNVTYTEAAGIVKPAQYKNVVFETKDGVTTTKTVVYTLYALGTNLFKVVEPTTSTGSSSAGSYTAPTSYIPKNYLVIRNVFIESITTNPVYDKNGLLVTAGGTKAGVFAWAYIDGAMKKIQIAKIDGADVVATQTALEALFDYGQIGQDITNAAYAEKDLCSYVYDAETNTYAIWTAKNNPARTPAGSTNGVPNGWNSTTGKWSADNGFSYGGSDYNGNLGDTYILRTDSASRVSYNDEYGVYQLSAAADTQNKVGTFVLDGNSKFIIALKKVADRGTESTADDYTYLEYKTFTKDNMPSLNDVEFEGFNALFTGTNNGTAWGNKLKEVVFYGVLAGDKWPGEAEAPAGLLKESIVIFNSDKHTTQVYNANGTPCWQITGLRVSDGKLVNVQIPAEYNDNGIGFKALASEYANAKAVIMNTKGEWVVDASVNVTVSATNPEYVAISGNKFLVGGVLTTLEAVDGLIIRWNKKSVSTLTSNDILEFAKDGSSSGVTTYKAGVPTTGVLGRAYTTTVTFGGKTAYVIYNTKAVGDGNTFMAYTIAE